LPVGEQKGVAFARIGQYPSISTNIHQQVKIKQLFLVRKELLKGKNI